MIRTKPVLVGKSRPVAQPSTMSMGQQLLDLQHAVEDLRADVADIRRERDELRAKLASMSMSLAGFRRVDRERRVQPTLPGRSLEDICAEVAAKTGIPTEVMRGTRKKTSIGAARYVFCERSVAAGYAHKEIGAFLGGRPSSYVNMRLLNGRRAGASWQ